MRNQKIFQTTIALLLLIAIALFTSCERDLDVLEPATYPDVPEVFIDGFSAGLNYAAFGGSKVTAFDVDNETKYSGTASMKFAVPDFEDPAGAYAGGTYFTSVGRDLTGYDALTFWAKASKSANIDVLGFGNDAAELKYLVSVLGMSVNTNWKKYFIPIPDPSLLSAERGMFFYSEGPEDGKGYTFWVDEVKFEKVGTVAHQRPAILEEQEQVIDAEIGDELQIGGTFTVFNMPQGTDQRFEVAPAHFKYNSSDSTIATVNEFGVVSVRDSGSVVITAKLAGIAAKGSMTVNSVGALPSPSTPAPTPTVAADSVISMFSNAYTDVPVDVWNTFWENSTTLTEDIQISGNDVKLYTKLNFVGIEFASTTIDASEMTHFHLDIWTPDPTDAPAAFKVLLVDFGPDGQFDGGDDASHEVSITAPVLKSKEWVSLDLPLSDFTGLTRRSNLAQLVLSSGDQNPNTVYVDNVYFYNDGSGGGGSGGNTPAEAAPNPTKEAANVISVFSDAFTDIDRNLNPDWGQATDVSEISINGNNTLKYATLNFQGLELGASQDVSGMENLHLDIWTDNSTALNVYLISTGPVETAFALPVPTDGWSSVDIPLSAFATVNLADVIQLKFEGNGDIYLDNIYFYKTGGGGNSTEPTEPAPAPTQDAANVLSIFSDSYTDADGSNFFPDWGQSTVVTTENIQGNAALKYANFNYQGIELSGSQDVSSMGFLHIDMWTVDATVVKVTPINSSGSPMELLVSMEPITPGVWNSYDIPLTEFTNAGMSLNEIFQFKFDGQEGTNPSNIYIDNIYFYKEGGGGNPTEPTSPADTPTFDAANVVSLFSNAYSNVNVDTWSAEWDEADLADIQISGNDVKLYTNLSFAGIEATSQTINASEMTHFHLQVWTPDPSDTPAALKVKLVDFGADGSFQGGDDVEHELTFNTSSVPALSTGNWVTLDIPLTDFANLTTKSSIAQIIISGDINTVYLDNMLFHK